MNWGIWTYLGALVLVVACSDDSGTPPATDAGPDSAVRCNVGADPDGDTIPTDVEGVGDADGDGRPNFDDPDADGDGVPDIEESGDANCNSDPLDTDLDGVPDYLDADSNGDGRSDGEQRDEDVDEDGVPDAYDIDVDGDGILNPDEMGADGLPVDTDSDAIPDHLDEDSDGDTIRDADEGSVDSDGDGIPNFRDLESDGDGIDDAIEAGDGDVNTAPAECPEEVDFLTGEVRRDLSPDFLDADRDNDGASDADEIRFGTDLCGVDSDNDGFGDLIEIAREQTNCPDGMTGTACGCATSPGCGIPPTDFFLVLPFNGEPLERDLSFATDIRTADVFFLTDTTGSMSGTLNNVKNAVAAEGTGLIASISETIPDAWFGGGQHDDFPFGSFGGGRDEPFILAIRATPPSGASAVEAAFRAMELHGGGDGPESHVEALFRIMTGRGETWTSGGSTYTMRNYRGECLDGGWGAACFREGSLPIIVHFTDICSHNAPPGDSGSCGPYSGIDPSPAQWGDAIREMNNRGAKFVGINASSSSCSGVVGASGSSPCYFLRQTAEATSSIDLDGSLLVYDLPNTASLMDFRDQVVSAIETVATRVPIDVSTALRDDPDPSGVDATRFIKRRQPACRATPPTEPCWTPPEDVALEDAVAAVDESTFFGAIPGTEVLFRITFQNDFYRGQAQAQVFIAYIDVRGSGAAVLDTRQVFIVIPASSIGPG